MQAEYSRVAINDIDAIADTIRKDRPSETVRFLNGVERTVARLQVAPESAALYESDHTELEGLRVCQVRRFKRYLLFYRVRDNSIIIERILHSARNLEDLL
jgi:toxin ParE1/3/4